MPPSYVLQPAQEGLYRDLDTATKEIRLLVLQAASAANAPIQCRLKYANLRDESTKAAYETVSYVWGDPNDRSTISIDGMEVEIPASSTIALRRMRLANRDRVLWIDAVCIDQASEAERSSQVALMSEIYSISAGNLVWLSETDDTTERALQSIQLILDEIRTMGNGEDHSLDMLYYSGGGLRWTIALMKVDIDLAACERFFSSRYWTRRWVVQEVALAPRNTCHCGSSELPLEDVLIAAAYICYHYLTFARMGCCPGAYNAAIMHNFSGGWYDRKWKNSRDSWIGFSTLMTALQNFENGDPKDCVYSVLALYQKFNPSNPRLPGLLQPDYTSPLHVVLTKAVTLSLLEYGNLGLLNDVHHRVGDELEENRVPSWVPRFDRKRIELQDATALITCFRADGDFSWKPPRLSDSPEDFSLRLATRGYRCTTISEFTKTMTNRMCTDAPYTALTLLEIDNILRATLKSSTSSRNAVLGLTLCASRNFAAQLMQQDDATAAFTDFQQYLIRHQTVPPWPARLDDSVVGAERRRAEYKHEVFHVCRWRRFFGTADGKVGVGPQTMRTGDVVAVLAGCAWPVILRAVEEGSWRFVGTAYVYGMMFGEEVERLQGEGREMEEWSLV